MSAIESYQYPLIIWCPTQGKCLNGGIFDQGERLLESAASILDKVYRLQYGYLGVSVLFIRDKLSHFRILANFMYCLYCFRKGSTTTDDIDRAAACIQLHSDLTGSIFDESEYRSLAGSARLEVLIGRVKVRRVHGSAEKKKMCVSTPFPLLNHLRLF